MHRLIHSFRFVSIHSVQCHLCEVLERHEVVRDGNSSGEELFKDQSDNAKHGQTSVLELLHTDLLLAGIIELAPLSGPVKEGITLSGEGLAAIQLGLVLGGLDRSAKDDELGPELRAGLHDGSDGVDGGDIVGREGSDIAGPQPANKGKHGNTAVGELGLDGKVSRDVLPQTSGVVLWACGCFLESERKMVEGTVHMFRMHVGGSQEQKDDGRVRDTERGKDRERERGREREREEENGSMN